MEKFEMVAKTFAGLEEVLAEELRNLGAENVEPGRRMVSFEGDLEMLYKANLCCRTALRILKPFYKFTAHTPDELYEQAKEFDWSSILSLDKTFCIDTVAYSEDFTHSHFVTYRIKDAIADWFRDKYDQRPGVRLKDADVMINVHIAGGNVTLSLDSSGESLHKRGYRVAQTEAPINEVLAAGIILMSGWRGDCPFVDPMCGSGTFLIEAALIAANINPGIYRKSFAFESWPDFDADLFESLYNDESGEKEVNFPIIGADISPAAISITNRNIKSAGVGKYIETMVKPIALWEEAPQPAGVLITNPPYGERISVPDMEGLYATIGNRLKKVFPGYHAWIIGYQDEYFQKIGLAPSQKLPLFNGSLECELREYVIFEGDKRSFRAAGGKIKEETEERPRRRERDSERDDRRSPRRFGDRDERRPRREFDGEKHNPDENPWKRRANNGEGDEAPREKRRFDRRDDRKGERREFGKDSRRGDRRDDRRGDRREFGKDSRRDDRRDDRRGDRREFDKDSRRDDRRGDRREFGKDSRRDDRRGDRREFGKDSRRDDRRFDRRDDRRFDRNDDRNDENRNSENPLAKRRNPEALRLLQNKMPSLPPAEGPIMRERKKKHD